MNKIYLNHYKLLTKIKSLSLVTTAYSGDFNVTNKTIIPQDQFYSTTSIKHEDFTETSVKPGADELVRLCEEIKRIDIESGYLTEETYPFVIKPKILNLRF